MPLEQIRPLLSLDSTSPTTRKSALAEDDDDDDDYDEHRLSSPQSPQSPTDRDALPYTSLVRGSSFSSPSSLGRKSSILGPTSPTVRSYKSLFSDHRHSSSYGSYSQWPQPESHVRHYPQSSQPHHSHSPERRQSSESASNQAMDLKKLGAVGGVNRSGSWRANSVSFFGRGHLAANTDSTEDSDASLADTTVLAPLQRQLSPPSLHQIGSFSPKHADSRQLEVRDGSSGSGGELLNDGERDCHPSIPSSRTSTNGSHNSSTYSAAAFSLRFLSNRSSTSSNVSQSSTTASISPPSDASGGGPEEGEPDFLPRNPTDADDSIRQSSFVVGPGVSRVRSIGRGMTGGEELEQQRQCTETDQQTMAMGPAVDEEHPQAVEAAIEFDQHVGVTDAGPDRSVAATASAEPSNSEPRQSPEAETLVSYNEIYARSPRAATSSQESAEPSDMPSGNSPSLCAQRKVKASTSSSRLGMPATRPSPCSSPTQAEGSASCVSVDDASSHSPRNRGLEQRSAPPVTASPWSLYSPWPSSSSIAGSIPEASSPFATSLMLDAVAPAAPRRHTGGLRTRSTLGQQLGISSRSGSTASSATAFGGPGQEGGRRAARERARHPSLADFDNAPFSVLEAMRRGIPAPSTQTTSESEDRASVGSSASGGKPTPDEVKLDYAGDPPTTSSLPLSPIAHASPDAQGYWRPGQFQRDERIDSEARAFTSFASVSDLGDTDLSSDSPELSLYPPVEAFDASHSDLAGDNMFTFPPSSSAHTERPSSAAPRSKATSSAASLQQQADHRSPRPSALQRQLSRPLSTLPSSLQWSLDAQSGSDSQTSPIRGFGTDMKASPRATSSDVPFQLSSSSPRAGRGAARPGLVRALSVATADISAPPSATAVMMPPGSANPGNSPHPPGLGTHVLRTPTTEEWARYLTSQGLDPSRSIAGPRTRTSTSRSGGGMGMERQRGVDRLAMSAVPIEDLAGVSPGMIISASHEGRTLGSRSSFYGLRPTASGSSSAGPESHTSISAADSLSSLVDALSEAGDDDDDDDDGWRGSVRSRSSSGSSDSSQGRMEALHAAISMPPSRRGTPPPSMSSNNSPHPLASSPSWHSDHMEQTPGGMMAQDQGSASFVQDPALGQRVRELHGYHSAPPGHKRSIADFHIVRDIGRGAYGLVKLVRLRNTSGEQSGPEFVVKYIIKSRILADCWRRHRILGPIPVEIHVMDQLRRLVYHPPSILPPWRPEYLWHATSCSPSSSRRGSKSRWQLTPRGQLQCLPADAAPGTPDIEHDAFLSNPATPMPPRKLSLTVTATPTEKNSITSDEIREVMLPSSARAQTHPALCSMLDFFEDESFYYLIMPRFGQGTDLFDYIESRPYGLSTREARCILGQVASGLSFLHANNIVHRDIKDENVILDGTGHAQIIDFGSSAHVRNGRLFDTFSGTLDYAAAEILRGDKYGGKEQDVWALGVVAYVCLVGDAPFWNGEEAMCGLGEGSRAMIALEERCSPFVGQSSGDHESHCNDDDTAAATVSSAFASAHVRAEEGMLSETEQRSEDLAGQTDGGGKLLDAMDLIEHCLALEPADRPTAEQVTRHIFLAGKQTPGAWRGWKGWEE